MNLFTGIRYSIWVLGFLAMKPCFAQTPDSLITPKELNQLMKEYIVQLHNGALLMQLKTNEKTIEALQKAGNTAIANEVEKKQIAINIRIIRAFQEKFHFCPVYFFYSTDIKQIEQQQFAKIHFLNENLKVDTSIKLKEPHFLIATFDNTQANETTQIVYKYAVKQADGKTVQKVYPGSFKLSMNALIIKNAQNVQLQRPFPYFTKTNRTNLKSCNFAKVIRKMDKKLTKFYASNEMVHK